MPGFRPGMTNPESIVLPDQQMSVATVSGPMAGGRRGLERAERPPAQRVAANFGPPSRRTRPLTASRACSRSPSTRSGSRSASALASILCGRPSNIPNSASSAASPSSTAWRACSARSRPWASTPSASTIATPATCSPGCRRIRYRASSSCSPTLGRRNGTRSEGSFRPMPLPISPRVLRQGGELRFASDSGDYVGEALLTILCKPGLCLDGGTAQGLADRPCDWPETRYERKALSEGRKPAYLSFRRL